MFVTCSESSGAAYWSYRLPTSPVACCLLQHCPASPCLSLMPSLPSRPNMPALALTFDWKKMIIFFQVNIHPFFHQSFNQNNHQLQLLIIHLASLLTRAGLNGWNSVRLCPSRTSSAPSAPIQKPHGCTLPSAVRCSWVTSRGEGRLQVRVVSKWPQRSVEIMLLTAILYVAAIQSHVIRCEYYSWLRNDIEIRNCCLLGN